MKYLSEREEYIMSILKKKKKPGEVKSKGTWKNKVIYN